MTHAEPALARAFSSRLLVLLQQEGVALADVVASGNPNDHVDANVAMAEAFASVVGRPADLQSPADVALWGDAWDLACASAFTFAPFRLVITVQVHPDGAQAQIDVADLLGDGVANTRADIKAALLASVATAIDDLL